MILAHAILLAEARSYLAALSDNAPSLDAALEYERVLLQVDVLHDGQVPAATGVPSRDRSVLRGIAAMAIGNLGAHGVDALEVELCLAMLEAAWAVELRS